MNLKRKELSFAFIDIVSFGQFAKNHTPEESAQLIKCFYEKVVQTLNNCGGSIVELGGDSALVYSSEATSFVKALRELHDWAPKNLSPVKIKAGHGDLFVFEVTAKNYSATKIFGDVINETYKLAGDHFILSETLQKKLDSNLLK